LVLTKEERKAYNKEYRERPENIAKEKARRAIPEVIAKKKKQNQKYHSRTEVKAKQKEKRDSPEVKAKTKEYRDRPEVKAKAKERNQKPENKAKKKEQSQRPEVKAKRKGIRYEKRLKILQYYSNSLSNSDIPCCRCCGLNSHVDFLAIDHIAGRKEMDSEPKLIKLGYSSKLLGQVLQKFIIENNFPDGFQILCQNCNFAKGMINNNNICPHEMK